MNNDKPKTYQVVLKSGDTGIFINDNNYEDYLSRLVSGIYSILPRNGGDAIHILNETVDYIVEIEQNTL